MPYIDAKFSAKFDEKTIKCIAGALCNAVSEAFGKKPTSIMSIIECEKAVFVGENSIESGAFIRIGLLGENVDKSLCERATMAICENLAKFGIEGKNIYVIFRPTPLWGRDGAMF